MMTELTLNISVNIISRNTNKLNSSTNKKDFLIGSQRKTQLCYVHLK